MPADYKENNTLHIHGLVPVSSYIVNWNPEDYLSDYYQRCQPLAFCRPYSKRETSVVASAFNIATLLSEYGYQFSESEVIKISEFVTANPEVIEILRKIFDPLHIYFGESKIYLSLYSDTEEEYCVLNVLVETNLEIEESFLQERKFFTEFFRPYYKSLNGKIIVKGISKN